MYRLTIKYENFNGEPVSEDIYFHMSSKEWVKADGDMREYGSYEQYLNKMVSENPDPAKVLTVLEDLVRRSYGVKSEDGKRFVKDAALTEEFLDSLAYDAFLDELLFTEGVSTSFIQALVPKALNKKE